MPGALFDTSRISSISTRVVVDEVLDLAQSELNLRKICKIVQMPKLQADIRVGTRLSGSEKVPEEGIAQFSNQEYAKVSFELWKNVVHVGVSDESQMRANVNVLQLHMQDAARDIARMENKQIAEALEAAGGITTIAGSDWGNDANDPAKDIMGAVSAILDEKKGYKPDVIVMHPLVYADLVANENILNYMNRSSLILKGKLGSVMGLDIVVDPYLTNTTALILDTKAPVCVLGLGPTKGEKERDVRRGVEEYVIKQFMQPKLVITDAARILTGVHA